MKTLYIILIVVAIIMIGVGIWLAATYMHKHIDQGNKKDSHLFAIAGGGVLIAIGVIIIIVVIVKNSSDKKKLNDMNLNPLSDTGGIEMTSNMMPMQSRGMMYNPQMYGQQPQGMMYGQQVQPQGMMSGIPGGYSQTQWNTPISGGQPMNMGFPSQFSS